MNAGHVAFGLALQRMQMHAKHHFEQLYRVVDGNDALGLPTDGTTGMTPFSNLVMIPPRSHVKAGSVSVLIKSRPL